jgi:nucleotide-binding universal stress UspA family protein
MTGEAEGPTGGTVVGVDASAGAQVALDWALARADRLGPVRPVMSWEYPAAAFAPAPIGWPVAPAEEMQAATEIALDSVLSGYEDLVGEVVEGRPGAVLVERSEDADLVVVGSRGHGGFRSALLGSVSSTVASHAECPVAIIPHDREVGLPEQERIVVGIDGSANAASALRWALDYARPGDEVVALGCWDIPVMTGYEAFVVDGDEIEASMRRVLDEEVDAAESVDGAAGRITRLVRRGDPRSVLRDEAARADLLVLGSRGHTGVAELLLGSTTSALVHKPLCPVVVVPTPQD